VTEREGKGRKEGGKWRTMQWRGWKEVEGKEVSHWEEGEGVITPSSLGALRRIEIKDWRWGGRE